MKIFEKTKLAVFVPLLCSIAAILSLLGVDIIYKIKVGDESIYTALHLWDLFNPSLVPTWPIIFILVSLSLGGLLPLFYLFKKLENNENISIISVFLFLTGLLFLIAYKELFTYFENIENFKSAEMSYGIALSIFFTAFGSIIALLISPKKYGDNVKVITEDGLLIALALVLSFVKIPIGTSGGSINFQMLPLFIIALRRGPLHGFISSGIIYGLLACLVDGYGFFTYPFDYLLAFGSTAIIGLFRPIILDEKRNIFARLAFILLAGVLATLVRFMSSSVSSMLFYGLDFAGALAYNIAYVSISGAIAIVALMIFFKPFTYINKRYPVGENN